MAEVLTACSGGGTAWLFDPLRIGRDSHRPAPIFTRLCVVTGV